MDVIEVAPLSITVVNTQLLRLVCSRSFPPSLQLLPLLYCIFTLFYALLLPLTTGLLLPFVLLPAFIQHLILRDVPQSGPLSRPFFVVPSLFFYTFLSICYPAHLCRLVLLSSFLPSLSSAPSFHALQRDAGFRLGLVPSWFRHPSPLRPACPRGHQALNRVRLTDKK